MQRSRVDSRSESSRCARARASPRAPLRIRSDSGCNGCSADKHKPDQHKDDKPPPEKKPSQTAEDKLKAELEHEKHANEALQHHIKEDEEKLKGLAKADGEKLKGLALSRDAVQQQLDASHAAYDALAQELEAKRQTATELQAQIKSLRDQVKYADKCPCAVDIVADADAALARYSDSHSHATRSALALGVAGAGMLGMVCARTRARRLSPPATCHSVGRALSTFPTPPHRCDLTPTRNLVLRTPGGAAARERAKAAPGTGNAVRCGCGPARRLACSRAPHASADLCKAIHLWRVRSVARLDLACVFVDAGAKGGRRPRRSVP